MIRRVSILLFFSTLSLALAPQGISAAKSSDKGTMAPPRAYTSGICDASDVMSGLIGGKTSLFYGASRHAVAFLKARIYVCAAIIKAWQLAVPPPKVIITKMTLPDAPAAPASPCKPSSVEEPNYEYAVLQSCVAYIKNYVSTSATATPAPISGELVPPSNHEDAKQNHWYKNIYVMALASDAPTSAQISYRLKSALLDKASLKADEEDPYLDVKDDFKLVAAPAWTLVNLQNQCFSDPATAGAIVALQPSQQGNTFNFVLMNTWTVLAWQTVVISCEPTNNAYIDNAAYIRWVTRIESGRANSFSMSLTWALGAMAGVQAFNPTRTTSYVFTSPQPSLPPGQSYPTGYSIGVPSNETGALAAAGLAALTQVNGSNAPNLFQGNEADGQVASAIAAAVPKVAIDILAPCGLIDQGKPHDDIVYGAGSKPQCEWFQRLPKP